MFNKRKLKQALEEVDRLQDEFNRIQKLCATSDKENWKLKQENRKLEGIIIYRFVLYENDPISFCRFKTCSFKESEYRLRETDEHIVIVHKCQRDTLFSIKKEDVKYYEKVN